MGTSVKTNEVKLDYGTFCKKPKWGFVAITEVLQNILTMAFRCLSGVSKFKGIQSGQRTMNE